VDLLRGGRGHERSLREPAGRSSISMARGRLLIQERQSRVRASSGSPGRSRWCWSCVGGSGSSTIEVAASPPAIRLWPQLAFQLHQAPDPGAVGAEVGLDAGGRLLDGGQVDAEQLRTLRQRRRDRPAQVRVVPSPHPTRVSNTSSKSASGKLRTESVGHAPMVNVGLNQSTLWPWRAAGCQHPGI
jgi:hypothetical protein